MLGLPLGRHQKSLQRATLAGPRLIKLRDDYESIFVDRIFPLTLLQDIEKRYVRLMDFGAINSTYTWYRVLGNKLEEIAKAFVEVLLYRETSWIT